MQRNRWRLVWFANKIKHSIINNHDCCNHYRFLKGHGKVCPWISWWVYHHQRDLMWSWWCWINLVRWHTSFSLRKMPWPKKWKGFFSCMCLNIMASWRTLCQIKIPISQVNVGEPCGSAWGRSLRWAPHSNLKHMGNSKKVNLVIKQFLKNYVAAN